MNLTDIIIILIIAVISALAFRYVYNKMKKGQPCIGCPDASVCKKHACCKDNSDDAVK